ncbi:MAG: tetratricopeptide repeat protein [Caldilineaceae bacterium]
MSHPFGDLLTHYLHRKHGLSQSKLADGIIQAPSIISEMSQGKRLNGPQARERVTAIITWLQQQGALTSLDEANALLNAAGMAPLQERTADEAQLIRTLSAQVTPRHSLALNTQPPQSRPSPVAPRHNLPTQLTPFIGRAEQIAFLRQQLQTHRLLTLTGAGGVGKTRLAIEVVTQVLAHFADGVWFVDLTPLTDANAIPQHILDLWRVPEQPERSPLESLIAYLRAKEALLILDNCEHLIVACAELAETLLRRCPHLSLLATSREALNIGGETPWRVPSLTRPHAGSSWEGHPAAVQPALTPETLADFEAVTLFIERAALRQPGFALTTTNAPAVAQICSRLDGIPLALEMAAARIHVFTVEELARRLEGAFDERFQLLTSGTRTAPMRQQTLRATLEWSYGLLTTKEQWLLACLSVFSGGWSFAAAKEVMGCSLDQLAQLVNKSLVIADQQGEQTRYRLLETVRQFAHAQWVACGEQDEIRRRHAIYFLALAEQARSEMHGFQQATWLARLEIEYDNLRSALEWSPAGGLEEMATRAATALIDFWLMRGHLIEGRAWLERALKHPTKASPALRAEVLNAAGQLASEQNDFVRARELLEESLALFQELTDRDKSVLVLTNLGFLELFQGYYTRATPCFEANLEYYQSLGDVGGIASSFNNLGLVALYSGDSAQAAASFAESLRLFHQIGETQAIADVISNLGNLALNQGDYRRATALHRESLALFQELDDKENISDCLKALALIIMSQGNLARAVRLFAAAVKVRDAIGMLMPPIDAVRYENSISATRAQLDEISFAAAWAEGQAMTLEQAVEHALAQPAA